MSSNGRPTAEATRRDWWRRQIERQQRGELSVTDFCRQIGYSVPTFYYWKNRLRGDVPAGSPPPVPVDGPSRRFVPVSLAEPPRAPSLEIEVGGACTIRVEGGVDAKLLRAAIRAAGQISGLGRGAE